MIRLISAVPISIACSLGALPFKRSTESLQQDLSLQGNKIRIAKSEMGLLRRF